MDIRKRWQSAKSFTWTQLVFLLGWVAGGLYTPMYLILGGYVHG